MFNEDIVSVAEVTEHDACNDAGYKQCIRPFDARKPAQQIHNGVQGEGSVERYQRYQGNNVEGEDHAASQQQSPVAHGSQRKEQLIALPYPHDQIEDGRDDAELHEQRICVNPGVPTVAEPTFNLRTLDLYCEGIE